MIFDQDLSDQLMRLTQTPQQLKYLTDLIDYSRDVGSHTDWFINILLDRIENKR